jgi:hypothetical protein
MKYWISWVITVEVDPFVDIARAAEVLYPGHRPPRGRAFWVEQDEEHAERDVRIRAMERFRAFMEKLGLWE